MKTNHKTGIDAEKLAAEYLQQNNFIILESRYKTKDGEVDIIARNKTELLFVEVKSRKNFGFDDPISATQKKRIANAALHYISHNSEISHLDMRFDSIFVDSANNLSHITDAWRPNL